MTMATEFCAVWVEHDKTVVSFEGKTWILRVRSYQAIYPVERRVTDVSLEPTNATKRTEDYRAIRADLGDDWSIDVLSLSSEEQVALIAQLGGEA